LAELADWAKTHDWGAIDLFEKALKELREKHLATLGRSKTYRACMHQEKQNRQAKIGYHQKQRQLITSFHQD